MRGVAGVSHKTVVFERFGLAGHPPPGAPARRRWKSHDPRAGFIAPGAPARRRWKSHDPRAGFIRFISAPANLSSIVAKNDPRAGFLNFFDRFFSGYEQYHQIDKAAMTLIPLFAKLRELRLYESLLELQPDEHFEHEKRFMVNRSHFIDRDIPFVELP
jgi:hypothetical protein